MLFLAFSTGVKAQEEVELSETRITGSESLIRSFLLVCDGDSLKYSLVSESKSGVSYLEILTQDTIINHIECRDEVYCTASGEVTLGVLASQVVTASVFDSKGLGQMEKIKITPDAGGTRVYFIGSIPGFQGGAPPLIAMADNGGQGNNSPGVLESAPANPGITTKEVFVKTTGPEMNVDVKRNEENDYTLQISAIDSKGIDFIEILENGKFLDVQICENKKDCTMEKHLKGKKPGRNKYLIKSMNVGGGLSFQEQVLYFTE